jgi:S1-C subfamily serine protease
VSAAEVNYCEAAQSPHFANGFASLRVEVGDAMGDAIECEHANPSNGDTLQRTTIGLSFYRKTTNTPTFTNGAEHWGLTTDGLVYWTGNTTDPPGSPLASSPAGSAAPDQSQPAITSAGPVSPGAASSSPPPTAADLAARTGPSVVQVITDLGEGSGVRLAAGVITNAHVVQDASRIEIATNDGRRGPATVLRVDPEADLALLQTALQIPAIDIESSSVQRQGDEILVLGYPLGLRDGGGQATLTRGLISGFKHRAQWARPHPDRRRH